MALSALTTRRALIGVAFPADRAAILGHLRTIGAPVEVVDALGDLPDRTFTSAQDVVAHVVGAGHGGPGRFRNR